jgi:hypothetical protein
MVEAWGLQKLNRKLVDALGSTVLAGPFKGMVLSEMTLREHIGPYLLGNYEAELQPWLGALLSQRFSRIIDVGSKFGYYAVGFARLQRGTEVVAFDTDWWARRATAEMAEVNGVGASLRIESFCSPSRLGDFLTPGSLVISDCEGYERELFAEPLLHLDSATLLIEIHESEAPGVAKILRDRFAGSHEVHSVAADASPTRAAPVDLGFLTDEEARSASTEIRLPQEWLLFTPRVAGRRIQATAVPIHR